MSSLLKSPKFDAANINSFTVIQNRIDVQLFGAAIAAPNKATTILN